MTENKVLAVVSACQRRVPELADRQIREFIYADWPEGKAHLDWLEEASVAEITSWVLASGFWEVEA